MIRGTVSWDFLLLVIKHTIGKFAIGVNDTGGKIAAGISYTGGKFATGINDTGGKFCHRYQRHRWQILPQVSWYLRHRRQILLTVSLVLLIPVTTLPPVSTIPAANSANCHRYQRHRQQICHRCKRHRWQTMGTVIKQLTTWNEFEVKFIYIYANSTTQRCPKEIMQIFLIADFFHLHRCQRRRWCTLSCEYLREFSNKLNGPNGIIRGLRETDLCRKPEVENLVALSL